MVSYACKLRSGVVGPFLAAGLTVAALAATGGAAQAATTPTCSKKSGTTVRATKQARVFKRRGRVYACLYRVARDRVGRRFLLGDASVRNVRLAGRFVGYSRVVDEGPRGTVKELRRGRIV